MCTYTRSLLINVLSDDFDHSDFTELLLYGVMFCYLDMKVPLIWMRLRSYLTALVSVKSLQRNHTTVRL